MEIDLNTIPKPNHDVISRMVDNEAVLVLPKQGQVKVLNEVGAAIWDLINGERNVKQISLDICDQFEVEPHIAEADTLKFIAELVKREIISVENIRT